MLETLLIAQLRIDLPKSLPEAKLICEEPRLYLKYGQFRFQRGGEIGIIWPISRGCIKRTLAELEIQRKKAENERLRLCLLARVQNVKAKLCEGL